MTKLRAAAIVILLGILLFALLSPRLAEAPQDDSDTTATASAPPESTRASENDASQMDRTLPRQESTDLAPGSAPDDETVFTSITIRDQSQRGLGNARVTLTGNEVYSGVTDEHGEFQAHVSNGSYLLIVEHDTYAALNTEIDVDGVTSKSFQVEYLTVTGTVTGRDEAIPVDPVRVGFVSSDARNDWQDDLRFIRTQGQFSKAWVQPELDELAVHADGYIDAFIPIAELPRSGDNLIANVVLESGPAVYGTVMDPDRNPVSGARIFIGQSNNTENAEYADNTTLGFSDTNGEFRVTKPDQRANYIVANHEDYAPGQTVYRDTLPTAGYEIILRPKARVSGRVLLGDQPIAEQQIEAFFRDSEGAGSWNYKTDAQGSFEFNNLPPGALTLHWRVSDNDNSIPDMYDNSEIAIDLELAAGDDIVENFVLSLGGGTVRCQLDESIPFGETVIILDSIDSSQRLTASKEQKDLREHLFENVPPGRYNALVIILSEFSMSAFAQQQFTVTEGGVSEIHFQLGNLGGIRGTIRTNKATIGMVFDSSVEITPETFAMNMAMLTGMQRLPEGFRGLILYLGTPENGVIPFHIDNLEDGGYTIGLIQNLEEPYTLSIENAPYILEEFEITNSETIEMNFEF